jgi:hypothetical protein
MTIVGGFGVEDVAERVRAAAPVEESTVLLPNSAVRQPQTPDISISASFSVWGSFFLLGTINNLPFVVVNSAAKNIVGAFGLYNLIGAIQWANVAFGGGARGSYRR